MSFSKMKGKQRFFFKPRNSLPTDLYLKGVKGLFRQKNARNGNYVGK